MDAKQFLAEFKYIASATAGVQTIRNLILFLAINGELTGRDKGDDVASELYENIVHQKNNLIVAKHISKPVRISERDTIDLTSCRREDWYRCKLIEIIDFQKGKQPKGLASSGKYAYVDVAAFDRGRTSYYTNDEKAPRCSSNELLIICDGSRSGYVGWSIPGVIGSTLARINNFGLYDIKYLYYLLTLYFRFFNDNVKGERIPHLDVAKFRNLVVYLPPVKEQERIVAKVDTLMALCDRLEAQQQKRDTLGKLVRKKALDDLADVQSSDTIKDRWHRVHNGISLWLDNSDSIHEMKNTIGYLGCRGLLTESMQLDLLESGSENFSLPDKWSWETLDGLAEYITSGSRGWRQYMAPRGDIFIRSQDIKHDELVFENKAFVNLPDKVEGKRTLVRSGDLLITITGANVGKCAQVPSLASKAYVSQHVALVRVKDTRNTPFLHWWITNTYGGRNYIARFIYGDKPGLNLTQVGSIPIPLPPQDVQKRIVKALEHYTEICNRLATQIKDARRYTDMLATSALVSITGIRSEEKEKMKIPKTELVSTLRVGVSPTTRDQAPLTTILIKNSNELSAKVLWNISGLEIDDFYQQLKIEMANGWIVQPEIAYMKEVESS